MTIVEMQPNIMHVNQAEKCNITKDMDTMADYTKQQHIAATVSFSPEGSKKAVSYHDILEQEQIELSSGVTVTERPFDTLLAAVLNGEKLSEDEQERLDGEMFQKILAHYESMSNLRLSSEDERILEEFKKNFHMKQQALRDIKEAEEQEKLEEQTAQQEARDAKNAGETAEKVSEIDMLNKTLENMETTQEETTQKNADNKRTTDAVDDERTDTNADSDKRNIALNKDIQNEERNKNNIQELDNQRTEEAKQEREYRKMLDDCFERAKQPFVKDGYTLKERAEIYLTFKEDAEELAINREIARHQKIYDYESVSGLKIKALSTRKGKNTITTAGRDTGIQNAGQEFVRNAIAKKIRGAQH